MKTYFMAEPVFLFNRQRSRCLSNFYADTMFWVNHRCFVIIYLSLVFMFLHFNASADGTYIHMRQGEVLFNASGQSTWERYQEDIFIFPGDNWRTSADFSGDLVIERQYFTPLVASSNYRYNPNGLYRQQNGSFEMQFSLAANSADLSEQVLPLQRHLRTDIGLEKAGLLTERKNQFSESSSVREHLSEGKTAKAAYLEDIPVAEGGYSLEEQKTHSLNLLFLQKRALILQKEQLDREKSLLQSRLNTLNAASVSALRTHNLNQMRAEKRMFDTRYRGLLAAIRHIDQEIYQIQKTSKP